MALRVKLLSESARLPCKGSSHAAGYDLFASDEAIIAPGQRLLVPTDIAVALPEGTYGRIAPRSGLASKFGIDVMAGVIDPDYRGAIGVLLVNLGDSPLNVSVGDRIAQLILERIAEPEIERVDELGETARGSGGFGSTGL